MPRLYLPVKGKHLHFLCTIRYSSGPVSVLAPAGQHHLPLHGTRPDPINPVRISDMGGMSFHVAISWLLNVFSIPIILVNNTLYPYQAVTKPLITLPSPSLYTLHSGCPHLRRFAFPGFKKSLPPGPRRFTGGKPHFVLLASGQVINAISRQARRKRRRWRRRRHRAISPASRRSWEVTHQVLK